SRSPTSSRRRPSRRTRPSARGTAKRSSLFPSRRARQREDAMAKQWSVAEMEKRVARFKTLTPHPVTFLDQAFPQHQRDVFNLIGRGVSEEKDAAAEITDVRDFNVQMSRAKPGHGAGLHSHKTIET